MTTQNDERIWERLPAGEPPRAYYYAEKYFEMGPTRSIERVSKIVEISQRQLKRWSARCKWFERAAAYDHWREQEDMKEAEAAHLKEMEKWAQRAAKHRERMDQLGVKLEKLGEWMLAFPQKEVRRVLATDETGRPCSIQIVKAPRCAKRHLPGMVEAADRLATQALKEAAAANSVQEEDVWDELVPYVSETARVVGGSDTNREAVSGWGQATENAVPVRSCKERDTP